ncbi:MAG: DUF2141 domain-containing protein [Xanthomarina sp.]
MKTLAIFFAFTLTTLLTHAQDSLQTYNITVKIDNILNNSGSMLIGLHNENTFMKTKGLDSIKSAIVDGKVQVTFKNLKPGTYAVLVLHDANNNGKMDFDNSGMPSEFYGMSNNPTMLYGPPIFSDAKFYLGNEDVELQITL